MQDASDNMDKKASQEVVGFEDIVLETPEFNLESLKELPGY